MPLFRSKPKIIDAVQFTDAANPPRGVLNRPAHPTPVDLFHAFFVQTIQGAVVLVHLGEWIVDEGDGKHFYPIADEVFKGPRGYEPIGDHNERENS